MELKSIGNEFSKKLKLDVERLLSASEVEVEGHLSEVEADPIQAISKIDEKGIVDNIMAQLKSFAELNNLIYYSDVSKIGESHRVHKYTKYFKSRPDSVTVLATADFSKIGFVATAEELNSEDSEVQDSEVQDSEVQDSEVQDSEVQDSEVLNSEDLEVLNLPNTEDSDNLQDSNFVQDMKKLSLNTEWKTTKYPPKDPIVVSVVPPSPPLHMSIVCSTCSAVPLSSAYFIFKSGSLYMNAPHMSNLGKFSALTQLFNTTKLSVSWKHRGATIIEAMWNLKWKEENRSSLSQEALAPIY